MALADMMVVMQDGHIRQAGSPRDVFGNPASSFVARFIGGHNVLPGAAGPVAVRADRCRLKPDGAGHNSAGLAARVEAVEYQGGTVRVALMVTETGEGASVLLPDDAYDADSGGGRHVRPAGMVAGRRAPPGGIGEASQ